MRVAIGLVVLIVTSVHGQATKFTSVDSDLERSQWWVLSQRVFEHPELALSPSQADALFLLFHRAILPVEFDLAPSQSDWRAQYQQQYRSYFEDLYKILDKRQQHRFEQLALQTWMASSVGDDNLEPALRVFVGNVERIDNKLKPLYRTLKRFRVPREEITVERLQSVATLRWKSQRAWFVDTFGEYETEKLLGRCASTRESGAFLNSYLSRYGRNPETGERECFAVKWPVKVPQDWTLSQAEDNLQKRHADLDSLILRSDSILRNRRQRADQRTKVTGRARRVRKLPKPSAQDTAELLELNKEWLATLPVLTLEVMKARRYVEELGGDPDLESDAIREAFNEFTWHNAPRKLGRHLAATPEQTKQILDIRAKSGGNREWTRQQLRPRLDGGYAAQQDWVREVNHILDSEQKLKFKRLVFRSLWFSTNCDIAFARAKARIGPSPEQTEKLLLLKTRLMGCEQILAQETDVFRFDFSHDRIGGYRGLWGGMGRISNSYSFWPALSQARERIRHGPLLEIHRELHIMLEEIVGPGNIDNYIGDPILLRRNADVGPHLSN